MSIFQRLKSEARYQRSNNTRLHPYPIHSGKKDEVIILPEKPKKKRKIMEVQRESKKTLASLPGASSSGDGGGGENNSSSSHPPPELDDEEMKEDEDDKKKEPKKIPWGPPEILDHLNDPGHVGNVNLVIANLKKSMNVDQEDEIDERTGKVTKQPVQVVWDHSETKEGKKSDNNFFVWFETMAAEETRKIMAKENLIYE